MGLGSAVFMRDQGSGYPKPGCTICVESRTVYHAFGIKDQKLDTKVGSAIKKT